MVRFKRLKSEVAHNNNPVYLVLFSSSIYGYGNEYDCKLIIKQSSHYFRLQVPLRAFKSFSVANVERLFYRGFRQVAEFQLIAVSIQRDYWQFTLWAK